MQKIQNIFLHTNVRLVWWSHIRRYYLLRCRILPTSKKVHGEFHQKWWPCFPKPVKWELSHSFLGVPGFCVRLHLLLLWFWILSPIFDHNSLNLLSNSHPKQCGTRCSAGLIEDITGYGFGSHPEDIKGNLTGSQSQLLSCCLSSLFPCRVPSSYSWLPWCWFLSVPLTSYTFSFIFSMYS